VGKGYGEKKTLIHLFASGWDISIDGRAPAFQPLDKGRNRINDLGPDFDSSLRPQAPAVQICRIFFRNSPAGESGNPDPETFLESQEQLWYFLFFQSCIWIWILVPTAEPKVKGDVLSYP
jgi:hypothetical protein